MGEAVCSIARGSRGQRLRGPALQPAPAPVNFGVTGCNLGLRHQTASHQGWEPTLQPAQKNTVGCIEVARAPAPSHSLPRRLALSNFLDPLPTFCPSPPYPHRTPCPPTSCYSSSLFLVPPTLCPTSRTPISHSPRPLPRPFTLPPPSPGLGLWCWANMAAAVGRDTLPEHWSYGVCRDGRVFFIKCARGGSTRVGACAGGPGPGAGVGGGAVALTGARLPQ